MESNKEIYDVHDIIAVGLLNAILQACVIKNVPLDSNSEDYLEVVRFVMDAYRGIRHVL